MKKELTLCLFVVMSFVSCKQQDKETQQKILNEIQTLKNERDSLAKSLRIRDSIKGDSLVKSLKRKNDSLESSLKIKDSMASVKDEQLRIERTYKNGATTPSQLFYTFYAENLKNISRNSLQNIRKRFEPDVDCPKGNLCDYIDELITNFEEHKYALYEGIGSVEFKPKQMRNITKDVMIIKFEAVFKGELEYTENGEFKCVRKYGKWFISNQQQSWIK